MNRTEPRRTNEDWLTALRGGVDEPTGTVAALARFLRAGLVRVLRGRGADVDLDELAQESVVRVLESLDSFRGDSAFTTWALAVATRVAFTTLRRRAVRAGTCASFEQVAADADALACPRTAEPSATLARDQLVASLHRAIATALTERQRVAILAELRGVPTVEIAQRLGSNQNALYKLVHDARRKLRDALEADGFGPDALHDPWPVAER